MQVSVLTILLVEHHCICSLWCHTVSGCDQIVASMVLTILLVEHHLTATLQCSTSPPHHDIHLPAPNQDTPRANPPVSLQLWLLASVRYRGVEEICTSPAALTVCMIVAGGS